MNMKSIIEELNTQEDIKVQFSAGRSNWSKYPSKKSGRHQSKFNKRQKTCAYCKAINRSPCIGHDVKSCWVISKEDKADLIKAFSVFSLNSDESDDDAPNVLHEAQDTSVQLVDEPNDSTCADISRVECLPSPYFSAILVETLTKLQLTQELRPI